MHSDPKRIFVLFLFYRYPSHFFVSFAFSQLEMVQALLAPYENRSWAQTNWILVRLWKVWKPFHGTVECISIPRSVIRFRNNLKADSSILSYKNCFENGSSSSK